MAWKYFMLLAVLFIVNCNAQQFIPGQQLNPHEQQIRSSSGQPLYQQQTHLTGDGGSRNLLIERGPIPAVRSPHLSAYQQQAQHVQQVQQVPQVQSNPIVHQLPPVKNVRRPQQHVQAVPKSLDNTRRAQLINNYEEQDFNEEEERRLREQKEAESAHYTFDSSIQDGINDHAIVRQETRNGLALKGMYSYSDGFFMRTVHYEADEHGYRVTKEDITPIGDGPVYNPKGKADVSSSLHGSYSITADDFIREPKKNKVELEKKLH